MATLEVLRPADGDIFVPVCLIGRLPGHIFKMYACLLSLNTGDYFDIPPCDISGIGARQTRTAIQDLLALGLVEVRRRRALQVRLLPVDPQAQERLPHRGMHRQHVLERDQGLCRYCGDSAIEFDHVVPRSRGGTDHADNVVCACQPCNQRKGARTPDEAGMVLLPAPGCRDAEELLG